MSEKHKIKRLGFLLFQIRPLNSLHEIQIFVYDDFKFLDEILVIRLNGAAAMNRVKIMQIDAIDKGKTFFQQFEKIQHTLHASEVIRMLSAQHSSSDNLVPEIVEKRFREEIPDHFLREFRFDIRRKGIRNLFLPVESD